MRILAHSVIVSRTIVLLSLLCFSFNITVSAAILTTIQTVNPDQLIKSIDSTVANSVARSALEQQLIAFGVAPEQVHLRLNSMTDAEVAALSSEISELPAGGDALAIIAVVFLVLLFTDIAGYTDLFPFVKKTSRNSKKNQHDGKVIDRRSDRKRREPVVIEN